MALDTLKMDVLSIEGEAMEVKVKVNPISRRLPIPLFPCLQWWHSLSGPNLRKDTDALKLRMRSGGAQGGILSEASRRLGNLLPAE